MIDRPHVRAAVDAARAASRAIAAVGDPASFSRGSVLDKGAAGPATVADIASQLAAAGVLRSVLGDATRIMAEESLEEIDSLGGDALLARAAHAASAAGVACSVAGAREILSASADTGGSGTFWAIDPLDGTKGYLRGGQFAVAVALLEGGAPVLGVLAAPRLGPAGSGCGDGVLAVADRRGAVQSPISRWDPFPLAERRWRSGGPVRLAGSVERGHSASDALEARAAAAGPVHPVRVDSQAKYLLVARGDADAYLRVSPAPDYRECIWDHAAGAILAEACGCRVTDSRGEPLDFGSGRRMSRARGVACAPHGLHEALLAAVAPLVG